MIIALTNRWFLSPPHPSGREAHRLLAAQAADAARASVAAGQSWPLGIWGTRRPRGRAGTKSSAAGSGSDQRHQQRISDRPQASGGDPANDLRGADDRAGVLRSPPGTARYNGAVEAGIGSLKARLHHVAAAQGRAASPTCAPSTGLRTGDLEAARLEANIEARPWGRAGPSPEQRWNERSPITIEQREAFGVVLAAAERIERGKLTERRDDCSPASPADPDAMELNGTDRATPARRGSIRRALIECDALVTRGARYHGSSRSNCHRSKHPGWKADREGNADLS